MRYKSLLQMTEMCDTLVEAVTYIENSAKDATTDTLLDTCDEMLGAMASSINGQQNAEKYKVIVDNIEAVRKTLSKNERISNVLTNIVDIKNMIISKIDYKFRVILIAELGEKWDSLESLYQAFLQKENCDVSVVLSPIFRENDDKMDVIYKDYLTPLGIPFIEYKNYDFEKDMPDLAFTCQPYESVTIPMFWAENIAKHTRLVYVPYFAAHMFYNGSIDTMCKMPIFKYAWKTIGSSQNHYKFYEKYTYNGGKNMLVTGVPKWDGVVKLKTEGMLKQSENWDIKLKGKTVFLWNSFYDPGCSSLKYWEEIMKYFEANRECALIWRMHPMTKTVIEIYNGAKAKENLLNMERFSSQMPNVIVDNNTSYLEAFYRSDAQISDFSSMMTQYLLMDKPVLWIKNPNWEPTECAIDNTWMETADNENDIIEFFDRIKEHKDNNKQLREIIRNRDIPLADGKSGERVCDLTLELLRKETIQQL